MLAQAEADLEKVDWAALAKKAKGALAGFQGAAQTDADKVDWAALAKKAKGALAGFQGAAEKNALAQ
tara:strand:+ start:433 stop:633 length:201 start_codon:yes stop_codon:yes gene_type:complete